jgi:hypothetical protein
MATIARFLAETLVIRLYQHINSNLDSSPEGDKVPQELRDIFEGRYSPLTFSTLPPVLSTSMKLMYKGMRVCVVIAERCKVPVLTHLFVVDYFIFTERVSICGGQRRW